MSSAGERRHPDCWRHDPIRFGRTARTKWVPRHQPVGFPSGIDISLRGDRAGSNWVMPASRRNRACQTGRISA